jgi:hypothetical protein
LLIRGLFIEEAEKKLSERGLKKPSPLSPPAAVTIERQIVSGQEA